MDNENTHSGVCLADELSNKDDELEALRAEVERLRKILFSKRHLANVLEKDRERVMDERDDALTAAENTDQDSAETTGDGSKL